MSHNYQAGKSNQFLVVIIAGLLLLLVVFGLSKLIPRGVVPSLKASPAPTTTPTQEDQPTLPANLYTHPDFGFSVTMPTGWKANPQPVSGIAHRLAFVDFLYQNKSVAGIEIKDLSVDEVLATFRSEVSQTKNLRIVFEREVRLGNDYAKQLTVADITDSTETQFRFLNHTGKTFIISGTDTSFLDSFTFAPPTPKPAR